MDVLPCDASVASGTSDIQLYQEALSCMELIANNLKQDGDYPLVESLYDRCNSAIATLRHDSHNPLISSSLESLLETLDLQRIILSNPSNCQHASSLGGRVRSISEGSALQIHESKLESVNVSYLSVIEEMLFNSSHDADYSFEQVIGLDEAKKALKEAVVMPLQYPPILTGDAKSWSHTLLYGPPGTGKTKLAKALSYELRCSFYYVSSAHLLSMYNRDMEKIIRDLFQHAHQSDGQCVIFIDEMDYLCHKRNDSENETTCRVKRELLHQLDETDAVNSLPGRRKVIVLGATNCPWDMDPNIMRRFPSKIFIPLPDRDNRYAIIASQFIPSPLQLTDNEWVAIIDLTEGYSRTDLTRMSMAAAFQPIRELQSARFWMFTKDNKIMPVMSDTLGAMQYTLNKLPADKVVARILCLADFLQAIQSTPQSVSENVMLQYQKFCNLQHEIGLTEV